MSDIDWGHIKDLALAVLDSSFEKEYDGLVWIDAGGGEWPLSDDEQAYIETVKPSVILALLTERQQLIEDNNRLASGKSLDGYKLHNPPALFDPARRPALRLRTACPNCNADAVGMDADGKTFRCGVCDFTF